MIIYTAKCDHCGKEAPALEPGIQAGRGGYPTGWARLLEHEPHGFCSRKCLVEWVGVPYDP
jgi:hypothetical protein